MPVDPERLREEMVTFKKTHLYQYLFVEKLESRNAALMVSLINASLRSTDAVVRAIATAINTDGAILSALREIEGEQHALHSLGVSGVEKFFKDYAMPSVPAMAGEVEY